MTTTAGRFNLNDLSNLRINIEEQFGATYEFIKYDCTQNKTTNTVSIVMHLRRVASSPVHFSYAFEHKLIPEFVSRNFTVAIKFLDENGGDVAHQESGDFIERVVGMPS